MNFTPKKTTLIVLGVTSLICSRAFFTFLNDPEGPNLLIVMAFGLVLFFASLVAYAFNLSDGKKFLFAICIQTLLVLGLGLFLK